MSNDPVKLARSFESCQGDFSELSRSISSTLVTMYRNHTPSHKEKNNLRIGLEAMQQSLNQLADNLREL